MSVDFLCLFACLRSWKCEGAALDFLFAGCLLASLRLKGSGVDFFCLGACLLGWKCEGAALDFLFAGCLLASMRLKRRKCKPLLLGCLLARL